MKTAFFLFLAAAIMFFAGFAQAQTYDDGQTDQSQDQSTTSGQSDQTDSTNATGTDAGVPNTGTTSGTTSTTTGVGVPNTGAGGSGMGVWSVLLLSALSGVAGTLYLARTRYARARKY